MAETPLTPACRQAVRERAGFCCEYCFSQSRYCPDPLSIEHIVPRACGGSDELNNLACACQGCNGHKYVATSAVDPVTEESISLYHPHHDVWSDHFQWSDDFREIIGITPTGRATVERLQLNREAVVNLRILLNEFGLHPPKIDVDNKT
jgi:hypothetical protein